MLMKMVLDAIKSIVIYFFLGLCVFTSFLLCHKVRQLFSLIWLFSANTILFLYTITGARGLLWSRHTRVLEGHYPNSYHGQCLYLPLSSKFMPLYPLIFWRILHKQVCNPSIQFMIYESSLKYLRAKRTANKSGFKNVTALEVHVSFNTGTAWFFMSI